jgi:lysine 6-dehydrogenase
MKVLVLGCGEMGETAVQDLYEHGPFDEIVVATRSPEKAAPLLERLRGRPRRLDVRALEVGDGDGLVQLLRPFDVAVNCVGPNYRYEVRIARAAIEAGVPLVDINDDYETTYEMLELDESARRAGVLVVLGLGASPGVNNVLVRAAADQLDEVEEIHTAWVMAGSDPGGLALAYHLLYSLSGKALTLRDGQMIEVESFVDGRERIAFPEPVGPMDVFHVGHPEPITLQRTFPGVRTADDKASFNAPYVNEWIRRLGGMARECPDPVRVGDRMVTPMDFAAAYFHKRCKALVDVPKEGALRVHVRGRKGTKKRDVYFSSAGRIAQGTGIPAAIGAAMIAERKIEGAGVLPPEACVDPTEFLYQIFTRRNVAKLNGWSEEQPGNATAAVALHAVP